MSDPKGGDDPGTTASLAASGDAAIAADDDPYDGPPLPPTGEEDIPVTGDTSTSTTDTSALLAQIASLGAELQAALAANRALQLQNASLSQTNILLSRRISDVALQVAALDQRVQPLLASHPLETIGEAIVQAIAASDAALSTVGDGAAFTVSEVECDVRGYVSLSQGGATISMRPVQSAAAGEPLSVVRFRAIRVPGSA